MELPDPEEIKRMKLLDKKYFQILYTQQSSKIDISLAANTCNTAPPAKPDRGSKKG